MGKLQRGLTKFINLMDEVQQIFSKFINLSLKFLFIFIVFISFKRLEQFSKGLSYHNFIFLAFFLIPCIIVYWALKKEVSITKILIGILIYAFLIRMAWILSINSVPASDFAGMYRQSQLVLEKEYYIFKGHSYYARFPHLTMIVLYFAVIRKFFVYPLIVLKIINVVCSTLTVLFSYLIVKEIFNCKIKGTWAGCIAAIYPPTIIYTAVYCGENVAIPFYLLSIYLFILVIKDRKPLWFLTLSAFSLTIGNLFRMVAIVIVIAYIIYVLVYLSKSIKKKLISIVYILGSFLIPLVLTSTILRAAGIIEFNLWKGSESSWTSILKGTNLQAYGRYNEEDSKIVYIYNYDYEKIEQASKEIVKKRLTTTPLMDLIKFYTKKYAYQWREGDFGGIYWAKLDITEKDMKIDLDRIGISYIQLIYFILIILTYIGLFNKRQYLKNPIINLFYIIYCGYALLFLITESQERYSFIASWLFLILPFTVFRD